MDCRICIIGLGGAGARVVDHVAGSVQDGPTIVAVNTDSRALAESCATTKLQIGLSRTNGLGAGGDVSLGRLAAEDDIEIITGLFSDVNLVFLVVGLGGGTGTGAAPVVLNAAREAGAMTLCFAILPFKFEGGQRRTQADRAVAGIRESADTLIVVFNDRLFECVDETNVAEAFAGADEVLSAGICAIWKLIAQPGFINLDFADLQKVVRNSGGICAFGYGSGTGENKARKAAAALLESPLLDHGRIVASARSLLVSIVGGSDLTLKEIGDIMDAVSSKARKDGNISMGTVIDDSWQDRIAVTIVASEEWNPEPAEGDAATGPTDDGAPDAGSGRSRGQRKIKQTQTMLELDDASDKGRFKDIEPTILDGEDLDIPTFIRRRIDIQK